METGIPPTEDDRTFRHRVIQGEVNDENAWVMGGVAGHAGLFAPATRCRPLCRMHVARWIANSQLEYGRTLHPPGDFTHRYLSRAGVGHTITAVVFRHALFTATRSGTSASPALRCGSIPIANLSVTLLTNRTWPDRRSQAIKQIRPLVHDAIVEAL